MKVALISHLFPTKLNPFHGKFIKDQLTLLNSSNKITTDLIVPTPYSLPFTERNKRNNSPLLAENFVNNRVRYLSFPKKLFPRAISHSLSKSIQRHFINKEYDLIHLHWLYPDALCIPKLHDMGFKCVLTIHGSDWYKNADNSSLIPLFNELFKITDHVFYVGDQLQDDIVSRYQFLNEKSTTIYNFVDEKLYYPPTKKVQRSALRKLGWEVSKKHFLCVASMAKEKGVDLLIKAATNLLKDFSEIEFHIVGSNVSENRYLSKNIYFHSAVPPKELIYYYHAADAYISPSRKEGFGLAMIEAAASGLPIVATPTGIAPSFIDEETGILCDGISVEALFKSIKNLSQNLENYSKEKIKNKALNSFGKRAFEQKLFIQYEKLIT